MDLRPTDDDENTLITPSSPSRAASVNERYRMPTSSDFQGSAHGPCPCGAAPCAACGPPMIMKIESFPELERGPQVT